MRGLFVKDLMLLKTQMNSIFVIVAIAIFMLLVGEETAFVITYSVMVFAMFGITTMNYDHFDNGYAFLFTLPITRKLYMAEKYIFSFLSVVTGAGVACLLLVVTSFLKGNGIIALSDLGYVLGYLGGAIFFISIILPVQVKFGPEKGRIAMFAVFISILAGVFALKEFVDQDKFMQIIIKLSQIEPMMIVGGIFVIVLGIYAVSYLISSKIIEHKEF